jgi:hypothetical protein
MGRVPVPLRIMPERHETGFEARRTCTGIQAVDIFLVLQRADPVWVRC